MEGGGGEVLPRLGPTRVLQSECRCRTASSFPGTIHLPERLLVLYCFIHTPVPLPAPSSIHRALVSSIPLSETQAASL